VNHTSTITAALINPFTDPPPPPTGGGPHRTLLGVLVIGVLANGMNLVGARSFVQEIGLGFVVIIAVTMSMDRRRIDIVR
jgi:predicted ABC-type sugar transport system permease subunit